MQDPRRRRRGFPIHLPSRWAVVLLLAGMAAAGGRPVQAQGDPLDLFQRISVVLGGEAVFAELRVAQGGAAPEVWLEQVDSAGLLQGRASVLTAFDGSAELRLDRGGLNAAGTSTILPGDRLRLRAAYPDGRRGTRDIVVPPLGVALAPVDGTLTGWAPAGESVLVITADAKGGFASDTAVAEVGGRWSLDLGADLDLGRGASGTVLYTDRSGVTFQAAWSLPVLNLAAGAATLDLQLRPGEEARLTVLDLAGVRRAGGRVRGMGSPVTLNIRDAAGALTGLMPGDRLRLDFVTPDLLTFPPRPALSLDWPALTVTVDPASDHAVGHAPPGTRLTLVPEGRPAAGQTVVADAAGAWQADWAGRLDLTEDQALAVSLPDAPGLSLMARAPALEWADPYSAKVTGRGVAGAPLSLRLLGSGGQQLLYQASQVAVDGRFYADLTGQTIAIGAGERLEVGGGAWQASLQRLDLALNADADADSVSGRAQPGSSVRARLAQGGDWVEGVADAEGAWLLDLAGRYDLVPGAMVDLQVRGADGIDRGLRFPVFRMSVFLDSARLVVEGPPGLEVPLEVDRGGTALGHGVCVIQESLCETVLLDTAQEPMALLPGDTVLAFPNRAASASLVLVKMTAHIDPTGRDVTGESPRGQQVDVIFSANMGPGLPSSAHQPADNTGVYDYEVASSQWDLLVPGLVADVYHSADSGHRTAARAVLEAFTAWPQLADAWGRAEVGTDYRVEGFAPELLDSAGQPRGGAVAYINKDGKSGRGGTVALPFGGRVLPGSYLRLTHNRGVLGLRVHDLSAWLLDDEGRVAGWTAPFSRVLARYRPREDWDGRLIAVYGQSDGEGRFLLHPPSLDLSRLSAVEVLVESGQGQVLRSLDPAERPRRVYLPSVTSGGQG